MSMVGEAAVIPTGAGGVASISITLVLLAVSSICKLAAAPSWKKVLFNYQWNSNGDVIPQREIVRPPK